MRKDPVVSEEDLHAAADGMAPDSEPEDLGLDGDALVSFMENSEFLEAEGGPELAMSKASLAYGISVGILAERRAHERESQT